MIYKEHGKDYVTFATDLMLMPPHKIKKLWSKEKSERNSTLINSIISELDVCIHLERLQEKNKKSDFNYWSGYKYNLFLNQLLEIRKILVHISEKNLRYQP
jgi:hypothetical protein